jgi:hypothetical protein
MEKIKSNKIIIIGGALVAVSSAVYYFWNSGSQSNTELQKISENQNYSTLFVKDENYLNGVAQMKKTIQSELNMGQLSRMTVTKINQLIISLLRKDYVKLLEHNRMKRRGFLDNLQNYGKYIMNSSKETESLIENASHTVMEDLEIDLEEFESQSMRIAEQDPSFAMQTIYMLEMLKMEMNTDKKIKKNVDKKSLMEFLQFQIDYLENMTEECDLNIPAESEMLIRQSFASDHASLKFNFEEEDLLRNISLLQDPDVLQLQQKLQVTLMKGKFY